MNTPPNNHPSEARDVGSSNSNFNGINLTQRKILSDSKFQRVLHTPLMTDPAGALINHQKHGSYADLPAAKISELMKSSSLDNAPTQSLLSVVNGILEESVERRNGEIPQRVACLLRKVVQEIERRISTQQEHLRTQNNIFKTREEKYQSRIRVLETLASGTKEIVLTGQHQRLKNENIKQEEKKGDDLKPIEKIIKGEKKTDDTLHAKKINEEEKRKLEEEVIRLIKEVEEKNIEISTLKQEKKTNAMQEKGKLDEEVTRLIKEVEERNMEISTLKQEKKTNEMQEKGKLDEEVTRLTKEVEDKNKEISTLKQEKKTNEMQKKGKLDEEVTRLTKEAEDKNKEISTLKQEKKMSEMQKKGKLDEEVTRLTKEIDDKNKEISTLKQEKKANEMQEKRKFDEEVIRLTKEVEDKNMEISTLKQEKKTNAMQEKGKLDEEVIRLIKEVADKNMEISTLKQEQKTNNVIQEKEKRKIDEEITRLIKEVEDKNIEISTLKQEKNTNDAIQEKEKRKIDEEVTRLIKEVEEKNMEILTLKQEKNTNDAIQEKEKRKIDEEVTRLVKEVENKNMEISTLMQESETMKRSYEVQCSQLESKVKDAKEEMNQKSQEYENLLEKLRNKFKESEASFELKYQKLNMKQNLMQKAMIFQFNSIQKLKLSWESIKQDVVKEKMIYSEECNRLGVNLKQLVSAAENYQIVLTENRKLFNEVQELKGNIRVYCRIRPFLPGQKEKQSIVEHIGESDMVVANPSKQGKEALRTFKFNKIFGPLSTQAEVYADIQAFIRSVLDGYNVCIFAYGQTGSGKTYTMSGPNGASNESVGVNYRALNDLFNISSSRQSTIVYEIGVQVIEIYNEQVRDLLSTDSSVKKLGILNNSQPNGLAVPDASMLPVKSTADVIKLMDIGLKNRAKGSTAMNERSSRSHSVVSIHVRGADKKSGSSLQGNLHLVDLAGSERIDRSEVTGDRLKEAQHINKSLSALGDVIFALAQKSAHIPYRNSKLTQLLQSSLGGHAKTLMLVQINSDIKSYSESMSTLKFAERVSGVELGVAKSTKEGRDVRELMEQVASLKDTISTKDEEIERLQLLKDLKNSEKLED